MDKAPTIIIPHEHQAAPRGEVVPVGGIINISDVETDNAKVAKIEQWIASSVGHAVVKMYPRREWKIQVNLLGRMVIVVCPSLSARKGYHVSFSNRTIDEVKEAAVQGAGEILERYGMSRVRLADPEEHESLMRASNDEAIGSDAKPGRATKVGA